MLIDIIKQTPLEYSAQSRDYQVIARLYTALFNITKMYIDDLEIWNANIDNKLTGLRSRTLNFIPKHHWDEDELEAVTSCFKYLMMNKGTTKALEYCVNILMKIEKLESEAIDQTVKIAGYNVTIRVPENLFTLGILEDLIEYLLPSGLTFNIIRYKTSNAGRLYSGLFAQNDSLAFRDTPYNSDMYISPSASIPIEEWEETLPIEANNKLWFISKTGTLIPNNRTGIDKEAGVTLITEDGTQIEVKEGQDEVTFDMNVEKSLDPNYITDTFVYRGSEHFEEDN